MKKVIISIILTLLLSFSVSAWGASRVINANTVTINIDATDSYGIFTITETASSATITNFPTFCGLSSNVLICNSDSDAQRTITYGTSGAGSVSGSIIGRGLSDPSSTSKVITGAETIFPVDSVTSCTDNQEIDSTCVCNTPLEDIGGKCTSVISSIRSVLASGLDMPSKITQIAHALRTYFGLGSS